MSKSLNLLRNKHDDFSKGNTHDFNFETPFDAFTHWLDEAVAHQEMEANAMVVSTVDSSGQPSSRMLYLKELENKTFVFYTNYNSKKGKDLLANPKASLLFFWPGMERQVRIEGSVSKINEQESKDYFASRPRESQLGAWASYQSEELHSNDEIPKRLEKLAFEFPNEVPKPPHWGGYALLPTRFEFWQGKPSRLHDRIVFEKSEMEWIQFRLNP